MTEEIKTDYFTTEELAKYLGLSVSTLNSWRARSNPKKNLLAFPIKNSGKLFVIKNQMCMNMREDKHAETTNNLEIIEMGKHAVCSPSSFDRWQKDHCPFSAQANAKIPSTSSYYASEGTVRGARNS